jgi:methionine aminotransferase
MKSKLPDVGTTIFTVMSQRALELGAVNLGQGFPDYDIDPALVRCLHEAMLAGHNQYAPMAGVPALREQIALKLQRNLGVQADPQDEITVTLGGTEAIYSAIQALAGAGDEVIVFDPCYDSYDPAVRLAGARCVHLQMQPPAFLPDWDQLRAALNERTRLVIINSPHNPGTSRLDGDALQRLAELLRGRDCRVLSDEVYEHLVYDGARHASVLGNAELRERSVAVFSFGKALHATGLRVGYAVAPAPLTQELRKVHQFNTFSIGCFLQHGIASYLQQHPDLGTGLTAFYSAKRQLLCDALAGSRFSLPRAAGSYFQLIDYSAVSDDNDLAVCERVLVEAGVATIPLSAFCLRPPPLRLLRLCFTKRDETLREGARRLRAWADAQG